MIAAQAAPAKIRFEGVGKTFLIRSGPLTAVEQIDLDIPAGSFFVIVGPSGCGKTTLLRMAAGLETANHRYDHDRARRRQPSRQLDDLSGRLDLSVDDGLR